MIQVPQKSWSLTKGITAHRGDSSAFPENTMAAFKSAIRIGVDWIELDIHETLDGKIVVIHDADTNRVAGVGAAIQEITYAELKQIDVASIFRESKGLSLKQCPPTSPPLLSEVIDLIKSQNRTRVSIHPRGSVVEHAVLMVKKMMAESWVGFNDTNLEKMKRVKALGPFFTVFYDRWQSEIEEDIKNAKAYDFKGVVINQDYLTEEKLKALHGAGLEAGVWTVDDAKEMVRFVSLGVDRFYTNAPGILFDIKRQWKRGGDKNVRL